MNTQEITNGNKLIAEFMGFIIKAGDWKESFTGWYDTKGFLSVKYIRPENLLFNSSWDWLMPVVEKIESLGYCFRIESNDIFVMDNETSEELIVADDNTSKINGVWWSCVKFIEWYNENKN